MRPRPPSRDGDRSPVTVASVTAFSELGREETDHGTVVRVGPIDLAEEHNIIGIEVVAGLDLRNRRRRAGRADRESRKIGAGRRSDVGLVRVGMQLTSTQAMTSPTASSASPFVSPAASDFRMHRDRVGDLGWWVTQELRRGALSSVLTSSTQLAETRVGCRRRTCPVEVGSVVTRSSASDPHVAATRTIASSSHSVRARSDTRTPKRPGDLVGHADPPQRFGAASVLRADVEAIAVGTERRAGELRSVLAHDLEQRADDTIRAEHDELHVVTVLGDEDLAIAADRDVVDTANGASSTRSSSYSTVSNWRCVSSFHTRLSPLVVKNTAPSCQQMPSPPLNAVDPSGRGFAAPSAPSDTPIHSTGASGARRTDDASRPRAVRSRDRDTNAA